MKKFYILIIFAATLLFGTAHAQEANRVFITSTFYDGNLGDLSGADAKCQSRADVAEIGGSWKAWLSNSSFSVSERFIKQSIPYTLLDGTIIANDWQDLTDGTINSPINITEFGSLISGTPYGPRVRTNTLANGEKNAFATSFCNNWTSNSWWERENVGFFNTTYPNAWSYGANYYCGATLPLYCFEQPPVKPNAPLNLSINRTDLQLFLSWDMPDFDGGLEITNYKIYRSEVSEQETLLTTVGDNLSYTDINLDPNKNYYYKVSAVNSVGESDLSNEVAAISTANSFRVFVTSTSHNGNLGGLDGADAICQQRANSAGMNGFFRAWLSDGSISAASRIPNSESQKSYNLTNGLLVAENWNDLLDGSLNSPINRDEIGNEISSGLAFTNTNSNGSIASINSRGHCSNWTSNSFYYHGWLSYKPIKGGINFQDSRWSHYSDSNGCDNSNRLYCVEIGLDSPKNLSSSFVDGVVVLNWQPSGAPVADYKIYRDTITSGETLLETISGSTYSYSDSTIASGNTYYYKVRGSNPDEESGFSNEVKVAIPSAPTLSASPGNGQVILNWNSVGSEVTNYKIYRSEVSGQETLLTTVGNTTSYADNIGSAYSNRKNFYYKISAVTASGESPLSNEASAMPNTVPDVPRNVSAVPGPNQG